MAQTAGRKEAMKNKRLLDSFRNAAAGIERAFLEERNMKLHTLAAFLAVAGGLYFRVPLQSWALIIIAIAVVFICELINTAIENIVDLVCPGYSEKARKIKDIAAGAVMTAAILAVLLGLIVFTGPVVALFTGR